VVFVSSEKVKLDTSAGTFITLEDPTKASAATLWTDGAITDRSAGFAANASEPIVVTLDTVNVVMRVFFRDCAAIVRREEGSVTLVKLEQFKNMPLGRVKMGASRVTEARSAQPLNTDAPYTVILLWRVTLVRPEPAKALAPREVTEVGIVILVIFEQPLKIDAGKDVSVIGIVTS
jgi:hypothetical protein